MFVFAGMGIIDFKSWRESQQLYVDYVTGPSLEEYTSDLRSAGVNEEYLLDAVEIGRLRMIPAEEMVRLVRKAEIEYCYAHRQIEKFVGDKFKIDPNTKKSLVVLGLDEGLVDEAFMYSTVTGKDSDHYEFYGMR